MKPEFIIKLENKVGSLSIMNSYDREDAFIQKILQKKHTIVYSVSNLDMNKKTNYTEIILKTVQPFYIHLIKKDKDWSMDIYYSQENYKELIFFINQIEKI